MWERGRVAGDASTGYFTKKARRTNQTTKKWCGWASGSLARLTERVLGEHKFSLFIVTQWKFCGAMKKLERFRSPVGGLIFPISLNFKIGDILRELLEML
jgi:hypothetical protein